MKNLLSSSYPEGFDRIASGGGNAIMSTAYLARWSGPIRDRDDPYVDISNTSPTNIPAVKHVQNVLFLPDRANATDNNNLKTALMTYGVVYTSMYWNGLYFNDTCDSYYYPLFISQNHAVGIVGWDDHYSRYNFTTVPPGDGAFIIKNSGGRFLENRVISMYLIMILILDRIMPYSPQKVFRIMTGSINMIH